MDFLFHVLKMLLSAVLVMAVLAALIVYGPPWIIAFILVTLYLIFRGKEAPEKK